MILGHTIKDYKRENLLHDVITGIIIMAVSIPISIPRLPDYLRFMGYMGLYFQSFCLHYFLHLRSSSLEWMRHQQRWLDQHFLG